MLSVAPPCAHSVLDVAVNPWELMLSPADCFLLIYQATADLVTSRALAWLSRGFADFFELLLTCSGTLRDPEPYVRGSLYVFSPLPFSTAIKYFSDPSWTISR